MSVEIEKVLESFASSKRAGAIAISGPWGAGKTYLWQHRVVPKVLAKPWEKRYSYVSLFGINSLSELKVALAAATGEFDQDARRQRRLIASPVRLFWRSWKVVSDGLGIVPRVGAGLSKLFDRFSFYLVRDRIICFDDIERHGKGLDLRDFLGLVSYLSEQRECRVVVILNDGQLDEDDTRIWESYREKVFQGDVTYAPTPDQTVTLGLQEEVEKPWHAPLRQALMELRISNIRLVRRSADFMALADDALGSRVLRQETLDSIARAVAMLVFSIHGRGAGGPPLSRIRSSGVFDTAMRSRNGEDTRSPKEKEWDTLISTYRLYLYGDLNLAVEAMVRLGFPEELRLRKAVEDEEANNAINAAKRDWHQAWRLYHDTVEENGAEIVEAFERTWPLVAAVEHSTNLQSAVRMVRMLGRPDLADSFIRDWISTRIGDRTSELDPHELHMFQTIEDPVILEAVEQARVRAARALPLRDAFEMMRADNGYHDRAIASFAAASVEEIVLLIDGTVTEGLASALRRILLLPQNPGDASWGAASQNVKAAAELIAGRSVLAADRMRNWLAIEPAPMGGGARSQGDGATEPAAPSRVDTDPIDPPSEAGAPGG